MERKVYYFGLGVNYVWYIMELGMKQQKRCRLSLVYSSCVHRIIEINEIPMVDKLDELPVNRYIWYSSVDWSPVQGIIPPCFQWFQWDTWPTTVLTWKKQIRKFMDGHCTSCNVIIALAHLAVQTLKQYIVLSFHDVISSSS